MDDSLSDFKEKKDLAGPKNHRSGITQRKHKNKKLKGQKDIRTALRSKKSDIIKYTEDFNKVCIKSGLDVDSEQLQIAIALSKSAACEGDTLIPESSSSQNSQDRIAKIRRTLIEYGFKVPETKIIKAKGKKNKKDYKLLLTTEIERQQIIADKYSQVLFEPLNKVEVIDSKPLLQDQNQLYYLTTHASYEKIRDDNIFYVKDLVEISINSIGSLLKDWSLIIGRPSSPVKQEYKMYFNKLDHSQHERDAILSGTLKNTKEILKRKQKNQQNINTDQCSPSYNNLIPDPLEGGLLIGLNKLKSTNNGVLVDKTNSEQSQRCRSESPDLFEDDISIVDVKKESTICQHHTGQFIHNNNSVGMELTVCTGSSQNSNLDERLIQVNSQDITKRRSNDPMEITDCVATLSQPLFVNVDENKDILNIIDLVINPFNDVNCDYQPDIVDHDLNKPEYNPNSESDGVDDVVIQSSDTTIIDLCNVDKTNSIRNYVNPLSEIVSEYVTNEVIENKNNESIDLTQLYGDAYDSLPSIQLNGMKNKRRNINQIDAGSSASNVIIIDDNPIIEIMESTTVVKKNQKRLIKTLHSSPVVDEIDLTQPSLINTKYTSCDSLDSNSTQPIVVDPPTEGNSLRETVEEEISIVFQSDESDSDDYLNSQNKELNNSNKLVKDMYDETISEPICLDNLGKENDVSIDYDDISNVDTIIADITSENHVLNNSDDDVISVDENLCQSNDEFHVSDNEFNYSIHKSNHNFDLGGLSVMNDLSNVQSDKTKKELSLDLESNSFTPDTVIPSTPLKETKISFSTPTTSDYIIKTNEVTPMPDYASMPTEERNKELDKYGLKPFKRKRAIQLLTYIYNQMHPIVEAYSEEPETKKFKHNTKDCDSSLKNNININDEESSDNGEIDDVLNTDIYQVTNEVPEINYIDCDADDWVFQKKEKSKVHSCRVPLHIAFYNYISCRRLLREAMLRYEPVNIAVIHKDLVGYGHRYDPKDLLKFMDKRCITVKTLEKLKNR